MSNRIEAYAVRTSNGCVICVVAALSFEAALAKASKEVAAYAVEHEARTGFDGTGGKVTVERLGPVSGEGLEL